MKIWTWMPLSRSLMLDTITECPNGGMPEKEPSPMRLKRSNNPQGKGFESTRLGSEQIRWGKAMTCADEEKK